MFHERKWEGYLVSTDPGRLNIGTVHGFLTNSYWARGVTPDVVQRSIENSLGAGCTGELARAVRD